MTHPSDEADAQVLQRLADSGSDLEQPMLVDFQIEVPDEASGQSVAEAAAGHDFDVHVYYDDEYDAWTCECSREMIVSLPSLAETERLLEGIAAPFGGKVDGWGSFGNGDDDFDDEDEDAAV